MYRSNQDESDLCQSDEIAVATSLLKMANYLATGEPVYSVAEACHDCYLDQLISASATTSREIIAAPQPWLREL